MKNAFEVNGRLIYQEGDDWVVEDAEGNKLYCIALDEAADMASGLTIIASL